jgi:hypothetical protein
VRLFPNPSKTGDVKLSVRAMEPGAYTVQVDGGISLLLAVGAGLAARKFLGQRRPVQSPPDSDELTIPGAEISPEPV